MRRPGGHQIIIRCSVIYGPRGTRDRHPHVVTLRRRPRFAKPAGMARPRVMVACKLAVVVHSMWSDMIEFRVGNEATPAIAG